MNLKNPTLIILFQISLFHEIQLYLRIELKT